MPVECGKCGEVIYPVSRPGGPPPTEESGPVHRAWVIADIEGFQGHLYDKHPKAYHLGPARDGDGNLIIDWKVDPETGEEIPHVKQRQLPTDRGELGRRAEEVWDGDHARE